MTSPHCDDPSPFSPRRLTTLVASVIVALGSGTGYAFSAYGPQLGLRLKINHTQLNVISSALTVGAYGLGPIWGWLIDSQGPRPPLTCAFLCFLIAYSGIRFIYDKGLAPDEKTLPVVSFSFLMFCGFLAGAGSLPGASTAINSTAKTFPDSARATTVGLVLSGAGLSAFLFSTIAQVFFPGDTSHFLLILTLGTTLPMVLGFFLVRPIPLPKSIVCPESLEDQDGSRRASSLDTGESIGADAPLLRHDNLQGDPTTKRAYGVQPNDQRPDSRARCISRRRALLMGDPTLTNMFGKRLTRSLDFWLLFVIFSLLSGIGIMSQDINNVGSMSQALYMKDNPTYDDLEAQRWQTAQVSAISIMSCVGRILIGLVCDYGKRKLGIPRSASLILVSSLFLLSQIAAASIENVKTLWAASSLLGLGYGSTFSLVTTMCVEWFGMPHYAENYGYLFFAPLFGGNVFSIIFGRNLDAHGSHLLPEAERGFISIAEGSTLPRCLLGRACYVDTLYLTMFVCSFSVALSFWAYWRDREMMKGAALANLDQ